jgi:hypothetical protein
VPLTALNRPVSAQWAVPRKLPTHPHNYTDSAHLISKDIMQQSCATQDENELHWKGEDGQREDECKFKANELVSKDVPRCLAEPPNIAQRACR